MAAPPDYSIGSRPAVVSLSVKQQQKLLSHGHVGYWSLAVPRCEPVALYNMGDWIERLCIQCLVCGEVLVELVNRKTLR